MRSEILEEYVRVGDELARRFAGVDFEPARELVAVSSMLVVAPALDRSISEDPDDDEFLACALAARARSVGSGHRHLLDVSPLGQIEVLRPRQLLARLDDAEASAVITELDGIRLPILGRRQLIANKLAAGRPKDLVDAELLGRKVEAMGER